MNIETQAGRVAKNTVVIILGRVISTLIGIATVIYLARYLGTGNFGIYSFIFAYLEFFSIIVDLGTSKILVKEFSRDQENKNLIFGNAIILRAALSLIAVFLAYLVIVFLNYPLNTKFLVFIASFSFLLSFNGLYSLVFQANLKMEYPVMADVLNNLIKVGVFLWLIFIKASLLWFIVASVFIHLPGLFFIVILSRRFVRPEFKLDFTVWRRLFTQSWPIALTAAFIMVYVRIDQLMLFQMKGADAVGNYAAVVRLTEIFNIIPSAFMTSAFPLLAAYFLVSKLKLEKAYELSFKYMSVLVMPIAVGICILSEPIIRLIYGEQFINAAPAFSILIWSEIFVFLGVVHVNVLIAVGLQKLDFIFTSTGAIVNVILNLLLIPRYGIVGASVATVISYGLGVPLSCLIKKTRPYGMALVLSTLKPLLSAIIMGYFVYFIYALGLPLYAVILSGSMIYAGIIFLIRGLDKQDLAYFRSILASR
jgi:O-antigen/teichoic acid export membrane protein